MGWARYAHSMRVFVLNSGLFYIRWASAGRMICRPDFGHGTTSANEAMQVQHGRTWPMPCTPTLHLLPVQARPLSSLAGVLAARRQRLLANGVLRFLSVCCAGPLRPPPSCWTRSSTVWRRCLVAGIIEKLCLSLLHRPTQATTELLDKIIYRVETENGWDQALFNECIFFPSRPGYKVSGLLLLFEGG